MAYVIGIDAEGYANATVDQIVETAALAKREAKDLRDMDCGKVVVLEMRDMNEAEMFADYVAEYERPTKLATMLKKFRG